MPVQDRDDTGRILGPWEVRRLGGVDGQTEGRSARSKGVSAGRRVPTRAYRGFGRHAYGGAAERPIVCWNGPPGGESAGAGGLRNPARTERAAGLRRRAALRLCALRLAGHDLCQ